MNTEPNWYHVFDSTNNLWLTDGGGWDKKYSNAAEFIEIAEARTAAKKAGKVKIDSIITILGDFDIGL